MTKLYKLVLDKKIKGTIVNERNEVDKDSIIIRIRLRESKRKVALIEQKISNFKGDKKELIKLKMILKKGLAKVKTFEG